MIFHLQKKIIKNKSMLEQITTDMDVQMPGKKKSGKLASMKKMKYVKGVEVMDTELRSNVPVSQVRKEYAAFVKAMSDAKRMDMEELAKKNKMPKKG